MLLRCVPHVHVLCTCRSAPTPPSPVHDHARFTMSFSEKTEWVPFGRRVFSLFLGQHTDLSLSLAAFCNSLSLHLQVLLECLHSFSLGDARELAAAEASAGGFPCPVCGRICSTPIDDLQLNGVAMRAKQKPGAEVRTRCVRRCRDRALR
jgi:hypothetical protein